MKNNDIKIYVFSGNYVILGTMDEDVVSGIEVKSGAEPNFAEFIKARGLDQLTSLTVTDLNAPIIKELVPEQKLELAATLSMYKMAKKQAKNYLHNMVFEEMLSRKK